VPDGGKQQFELVGKYPYVALDKLSEKERWLRDRERRAGELAVIDFALRIQ
jgi:hypothetical protein